ncbi:post-GPI attachment to proteins factor 2-like [Episyrphus balteatus]|uniref:post-GPI attachment to proteins factor 2-like n=1 Tax=Episyrphus balteatus TaxID=286459 RepID=UPI0024854686|nr:post-GPI attachment to proteins factor 2-like [Episyrphus balteatus]
MISVDRSNKACKPIITLPFGYFAVLIVGLPFFSFLFCVFCSVLFFFEESTYTHCEVLNYLPSVSAAIGRYQPQRFVWQLAICLHFLPRLYVAKMYAEYYKEAITNEYLAMAHFACFLNVFENFALLGLSLWTSSQSYKLHKICFLIFIATSEVYMLISYFLNEDGKRIKRLNIQERLARRTKGNLFVINLIAFVLAGYCFRRHNDYCEPGVYTLFAFFEYTVVLINMCYHMTAYWDFYGRTLTFDWKNGLSCTRSKIS